MSLAYIPQLPIKVIDPLLETADVLGTAVVQGPSMINYKQFSSTSISASSIGFTCNPPSASTLVDRLQYVSIPVRLTMTGRCISSNGAFVAPTSLLNINHDALRKLPIQSALETLQCTLNGDSITQNSSDIIHALSGYYETDELRNGVFSMAPSMRDQSANYEDLVGFERNPLASWGDSQQGSSEPRGAFSKMKIVSNVAVASTTGAGSAVTAIVDCVITEPLYMSPFYIGCQDGDKQAFHNLTDFSANFNFLSQAGYRMWSHSAGAVATSGANTIKTVIDSIGVQFNNFSPAFSFMGADATPQMYFKYLSPNMLSNTKLGPLIPQSYPYFDVNRYVTDIPLLTYAAGNTVVQTNNVQLSTIPRKIYIYARPSNNSLQTRADLTDSYFGIENISVQFENSSALLSSANKKQLYLIDQKNHNGVSYNQWSAEGVYVNDFVNKVPTSGNPLCIDLGTQLPLMDASLAPGVNGSFNLQIAVTLRNHNSGLQWDTVPFSLYLVTVQEGVLTIASAGSAQHQIGIISKEDVLMAQEQAGVSYNRAAEGGDLWSSLKNLGSNVNDFLKSTKIISTIGKAIPLPFAQGVGQFADNLGYGLIQGQKIQGGQLIDREEMSKKMGIRRRLM
jgi:hypothetical protein